MKGHKQSLDRGSNKENLDVDMHKYKSQVIQLMQDGNKLRFVIKIYMKNVNYSSIMCIARLIYFTISLFFHGI